MKKISIVLLYAQMESLIAQLESLIAQLESLIAYMLRWNPLSLNRKKEA